jgi:hypothetical protein
VSGFPWLAFPDIFLYTNYIGKEEAEVCGSEETAKSSKFRQNGKSGRQ